MAKTHWRLLAVAVVAIGGIAAGYFWYHSRNNYEGFLDAARSALVRGDRHEADRLLNLVAQAGGEEQVACVRGEAALGEARSLEKRLREFDKWRQADRGCRILSDLMGLVCEPTMPGREPLLLAACFTVHIDDGTPMQRRHAELVERTRALLLEAMRHYHQVRHDDALVTRASAESGECMVRLKELGSSIPIQDAITRLRFAVERRPADPQLRRWLATLYLDMKAPNSAIVELTKIAELDPTDGRPHRVIGIILKDYHQYEAAKEAYRESLRRHLEPHVTAEVVGELAEALLDTGHPKEALETLKLCPEPLQHQPGLDATRAACLWELGQIDEAVKLAEQVMRADSTLPSVLRLRASIYLGQEQPQSALPLLLRCIRIDPVNDRSRILLADTYRLLGDDANAAEQGKVRDRLYKFNQELIRLMTELLAKPQDDGLRLRIGELWLGIGQLLEARNWFHSALEVNPTNAEARRALEQIEKPAAK